MAILPAIDIPLHVIIETSPPISAPQTHELGGSQLSLSPAEVESLIADEITSGPRK